MATAARPGPARSHPGRCRESKAATKGGGGTASTARVRRADGPVGPTASQGLSGRRDPATLPGKGEIGTGPPRGAIRRRAIASSLPGAEGGGAPLLYPREGAEGCPHAAGGAAAPWPGWSHHLPRPVPGGRARDSPAPGAPLRAAGPLTATALPLGELPARHSSPRIYWWFTSTASPAPPSRARSAGIPVVPPPAGPCRAKPPGSHWLQRCLSSPGVSVIGCRLSRPALPARHPPRGGFGAGASPEGAARGPTRFGGGL